jgi:3-O-methylgallate 3,4-dioxygenase
MAKIVLGLGTSHGPMLSIPAKNWADRVKVDRTNPAHFYNGRTYTFDGMAALRKAENLGEQAALETAEQRHTRCQQAIRCLGDAYEAVQPDVAVLVGNDQMEVFTNEHVPAFAVFWGPYVEGIPRTPEFLAKLPPGIPQAELDRTPAVYTQYPCSRELGRHVIESAMAEGFDVAQMTRLSTGEIGSNAAPHAYGFVYRRVLRDRLVPHVPVFVNTFYPPNQPRASRCWEFGKMLARAIASWAEEKTVAVIASGGMTHFVVNEGFDRQVLDAMQHGDAAALTGLPEEMFQSGTSEIKNWITVAGAMAEAGLKMTLVDYVPCYRSEAGTGSGMGFAQWR